MHNKMETPNHSYARRVDLGTAGAKPWAVVVTCSDSRVVPEIIFDVGLGDLYVIRVAGQVLDAGCIGSIEYAVEHLGVLAIVIVGHERCGAVSAAVDAYFGQHRTPELSDSIGATTDYIASSHLKTLTDSIRPAVVSACAAFTARGKRLADVRNADLVEEAVRQHVVHTAATLRALSPLISRTLYDPSRLVLAGFRYDIDSPPDDDGDALDVLDLGDVATGSSAVALPSFLNPGQRRPSFAAGAGVAIHPQSQHEQQLDAVPQPRRSTALAPRLSFVQPRPSTAGSPRLSFVQPAPPVQSLEPRPSFVQQAERRPSTVGSPRLSFAQRRPSTAAVPPAEQPVVLPPPPPGSSHELVAAQARASQLREELIATERLVAIEAQRAAVAAEAAAAAGNAALLAARAEAAAAAETLRRSISARARGGSEQYGDKRSPVIQTTDTLYFV